MKIQLAYLHMKEDIANRKDIDRLMAAFYCKLLSDITISYIFTDIANIDLETHMPVIVDFWESILFNKNVYRNNAMRIHLDLSNKTPLLKQHFETWLNYFNSTVDELFEGPMALKAKQRALNIATLMQVKISQQKS